MTDYHARKSDVFNGRLSYYAHGQWSLTNALRTARRACESGRKSPEEMSALFDGFMLAWCQWCRLDECES